MRGPAVAPLHAQVNLHSPDVGRMFDYLTETLEFSPEFRVRGPDGNVVFAGAWWGRVGRGTRVVLGDIEEALHGHYDHGAFGRQMEEHPLGTGVVVYFYTGDIDALHARIAARGAVIDEPPTDQFWGERTVSVVTPDGYYLTFAQPIRGFRFPRQFAARMESFPKRTAGATRAGDRRKRRRAAPSRRR